MEKQDIRWIQRFNNFNKAFSQLTKAVELSKERKLSELEEQGLIRGFEYTHELAWNTIKDFLEQHCENKMYGSKDATREAFKAELIEDGEVWMNMIKSRYLTTHLYDEKTAAEVANEIINSYFAEFIKFQSTFSKLMDNE
jgi:nucleotidyltransferase substrate binding protein (TIGR01987 family)